MVQGLFSGSMTPSRTKASPFLSLLGFYPQDICCIVAAQLIHYTHCFHIQDREKMEGDGGGLVAMSNSCNPMDCSLPGSSIHGDAPGKNIGRVCHFLLQGIFPTQGSNPGLLHCRQSLYQLSYEGSLKMKGVAP